MADEIITTVYPVDSFNTQVRNKIASAIVWHSGNLPNGHEHAAKFKPIPASTTVADLAALGLTKGSMVNAATFASAFKSITQTYTLIRKYRSYRQYMSSINADWGTQIASLSTYYNPSSGNYSTMYYVPNPISIQPINTAPQNHNIKQGILVRKTDITSFFNALYAEWNTLKENIATGFYYYCHTSCHNSCHGNRGVGW